MAILLIGSTGSGKSTLGNFLIDPSDDHMVNRQTFEISQSNKSKTNCVKQALLHLKLNDSQSILRAYIIDTPGLNEGPVADLRHMIDLVKAVEEAGDIKACIFVVKFDATIDAQYVETVRYYREIFPQLFENNVIIVMTKYCLDTKSVKFRQRNNIDPEKIKKNVVDKVVETGCLSYRPMVFMVDCQAFDDSEEIEASIHTREAILSYIKEQLPSVTVQNLKVHKTPSMRIRDESSCRMFEDLLKDKSSAVVNSETADDSLAQHITEQERLITKTESEVSSIQQQLEQKNKKDLLTINTYNFEEGWKFMKWVDKQVEVCSDIEIANVKTWTNGKCEWVSYKVSSEKMGEEVKHCFHGRVQGYFMRGVYASVTLLTEKRIKYAQEIADLKEKEGILVKQLKEQKHKLDAVYKSRMENKTKIDSLQVIIEETRRIIERTRCPWMTVADAKKRLDDELKSALNTVH